MINEYYANIKGYENLYQISNYGTIKSVDKVVKNNNGYRTIKGFQNIWYGYKWKNLVEKV